MADEQHRLEHDIRSLLVGLERIGGKVDAIVIAFADLKETATKTTVHYDQRLAILEARLNRYAGGLAVIMVLLTVFGAKIAASLWG